MRIIFIVKLSVFKTNYDEIKPKKLQVRRIDPIKHSEGQGSMGTVHVIDEKILTENVEVTHYHGHNRFQTSLKKYPFFINPFRLNDRIIKPTHYTVPSTYTDWRYSNPDPMNVFRSFKYLDYTPSTLLRKRSH